MASLNRFFSGLKSAGVAGRGNYLPYANAKYECEISRFFYKDDRKAVFVTEFKILNVLQFASRKEVVQPTAGETRSWVIDTTKELNMVQQDLNGFVLAVVGVNLKDKAQVSRALDGAEALSHYGISESNPFGGVRVDLETFEHKTKEKNNDFTRHVWLAATESLGFDAWMAKAGGGAASAAARPAAASAPATNGGAPQAPVKIGDKWFLPQSDGSFKPLG